MNTTRIAFVLDEHLQGPIRNACRSHVTADGHPLDVTVVGDPPDLPLGTLDPALLIWAERNQRILISGDPNTIPQHLANHLSSGHRSPGVFMLCPGWTVPNVVDFLALATDDDNPASWQDRVEWVP
jgi:hypothetical protein